MAGTIEGRAALLEWLARLGGIGFWLVEHDVFASDEHTCAISTMGARRDDVDVKTRVVSVFRYRGDSSWSAGSTPTTPMPGNSTYVYSSSAHKGSSKSKRSASTKCPPSVLIVRR